MASRVPGPAQNARIPISTITGVGRQAPSRRLPGEVENLDNVWCSVERGVERRPPFDMVPITEDTTPNGFSLPHATDGTGPFVYHWITFSESARYLIALDLGAPQTGANKLFWVYKLDTTGEFSDHTPTGQVASVPEEVWTYVQFGSPDEYDDLQFCSIGTDILLLNKRVKAGFTSYKDAFVEEDGGIYIPGRLFGLDGLGSADVDETGQGLTYWTASYVDPESEALLWNRYSVYAAGAIVYVAVDNVDGSDADVGVYKAKINVTDPTKAPNFANTTEWEHLRAPEQIPIEDNKYPDLSKPWIGQSIPSFVDLKFPPLSSDDTATFDHSLLTPPADTENADAFTALYGSVGGKIYFCEGAYLRNTPGYYQIVSDSTQPYTRRVRTPDWNSILDKRRMPMRLRYKGELAGVSQWEWSAIDWDTRMSGDSNTNPGPSVFKDGQQSNINAITFYRNRLWLASRDFVFASEFGNYDNFFLNDPANITDDDTIDIPASWGQYVTITGLVPFDAFLFINTDNSVQFLLRGTEGDKMSPLTAEVKPTSFYSTDPLVRPQVIGSQIYFFAPSRLYMYIPSLDVISAPIEVSSRTPNYLPGGIRSVTVAPAQDCIIGVDEANTHHVYLYVNRYLGTELLQSSFFRYVLPKATGETVAVQSMSVIENELYCVIEREDADVGTRICIEKTSLDPITSEFPYVDRRFSIEIASGTINTALIRSDGGYVNAEYDATEDETIFLLPFYDGSINVAVLGSGWDADDQNTVLPILGILDYGTGGEWMRVRVQGNYAEDGNQVTFGRPYVTNIELSPVFYRDDNGTVIDGALNLRTIHLRHHQTGDYDVCVYRRGRPSVDIDTIAAALEANDLATYINHVTSFRAASKSPSLPTSLLHANGELVAKVLGFADATTLHIISTYPTPFNITNIELHGLFRARYNTGHF